MQLTEITLHFLYRPPTHLTEFCLTLLVVELESSLKIQVSSPTKYVRKTARSVMNLHKGRDIQNIRNLVKIQESKSRTLNDNDN